jgi:nucleoside-diphosphate-sugar epimerase
MSAAPTSVLIAGASGLVGTATINAFLEEGWTVTAISRSRPDVDGSERFRHISVDLRDAGACARACADITDVTHVVYAAAYELPGVIAGWTTAEHIDTNGAMLRNILDPLTRAVHLRRVVLLQGSKAYGVHLHGMPVPARERMPRDDHPNFYWVQEDYIREKGMAAGFDWAIMRPGDIHGPGYGVSFNKIPVIGAYAAICKELGLEFGFPGGAPTLRQATDVGLLARAIRWAALSPNAGNEIFNVTNGEVFTWRDVWPAIAATLGVDVAADTPRKLSEFLPEHRDVWANIVEKHALKPLTLEDLLGQSHFVADFSFSYGVKTPPPPVLMSTIKIKQAGFTETCDTEQSICHWLKVLVERRVIPGPRV